MLVEYDPNQNQVLKPTLSEREEFLAVRKRQSLRSRRWKGSPWWWIFHLSEVVWPKCVCQGFVFWDFHPQSLIPRSCLFLPEWCTQGIFHPLPHPAFCGCFRTDQHDEDVKSKKDGNAFYKHLEIFHPEVQPNIEYFDIQVQSVHKKSLSRQKTEAVKIATSKADNLLNSKAEHRQPALLRVRMVRGHEEVEQVGIQQRGRRRGGE